MKLIKVVDVVLFEVEKVYDLLLINVLVEGLKIFKWRFVLNVWFFIGLFWNLIYDGFVVESG